MPVAHTAHDVLYTSPFAVALLAVGLLTWRSARQARRSGPASIRDE